VIADNQPTLNAGWNDELLAAELTDPRELAFDPDLIGLDDRELKRLLSPAEEDDGEDAVPGPPVAPVSEAGDHWLLGPHWPMRQCHGHQCRVALA
jgi:hypothetical protein